MDAQAWAEGQNDTRTTDLLVMPKAGWAKGQQIRVALTAALAGGFGRHLVLPPGEADGVKLVLGAASDGSAGPQLERRFPLKLDEEPGASTLNGAFPGGQTSLFQGLWHDPVGNLAYARNRWRDPKNASWLQSDPLGAVDSAKPCCASWAP